MAWHTRWRRRIVAGCVIALLAAAGIAGWWDLQRRLPGSFVGTYFLKVKRHRAASDDLNSDRELVVTPTGMTSRRLDNGVTERLSFRWVRRVRRVEEALGSPFGLERFYIYSAGSCTGSVSLYRDTTLSFNACARGEARDETWGICTNPVCQGFEGHASRR